MRKCRYVCLRFFLIKSLLADFSDQARTGVELFTEKALKNFQAQAGKNSYAVRVTPNAETLFYGKLSRLKLTETHNLTPLDVVEEDIEDWPFVEFLCDPFRNQVVVVKLKAEVLPDAINAKLVFENLFSQQMKDTGYSIRFEPVTTDNAFWSVLEASDKVYSVSLVLHSPNLFGANSKANEALKEIQDDCNNDDIAIRLISSEGNLTIKEKNFESYIEYAEQGGGLWRTKVRKDGEVRTVSSGEMTQEVFVSAKIEDSQERLRKAYDIFGANLRLPGSKD